MKTKEEIQKVLLIVDESSPCYSEIRSFAMRTEQETGLPFYLKSMYTNFNSKKTDSSIMNHLQLSGASYDLVILPEDKSEIGEITITDGVKAQHSGRILCYNEEDSFNKQRYDGSINLKKDFSFNSIRDKIIGTLETTVTN
ncbi:MAG: hypothetical protein KC506_03205 [Nanoarchaeota archaeon]|nr:hypothetical protein [Nanoarchaeota archaeon]